MSRAGMVIGLGGIGVQVVHRMRGLLTAGPGGKVPENIRLLAFDVQRPSASTGRLGSPFYFLVRLPPGEAGLPATRQAARSILLQDLEKGGPSSLTLRGLALNLEALRRTGTSTVDVFLVTSSFGNSGTAWLLDMAYLCKYYSKGRMAMDVHAVLIAPDAFQGQFALTRAQQLTSLAVLKELEALQVERDWGKGFSIYPGGYVAGMPGTISAPPFASVQVLDGQDLGGTPEQAVIPAAAEGILCQLDEQVAEVLRKNLQNDASHPGRGPFSSLGIQTLARPTRLLVDLGVQRAILGLGESLLPLQLDPETGRPTGLEAPPPFTDSDPYGNVEHWLGEYETSGVLEDVFYQANLAPAERPGWVAQLAARDTAAWKAAVFQVEGGQELAAAEGAAESITPLIQRHFCAYLHALASKALSLADNPAGPLEYLGRLELTLTETIADLSKAEEALKRQGKHSETGELREAVEESLRDWEQKRASSWSRLFPQRVEEAEARYLEAKQTQVAYQQREALLGAARKSASLMLTLTRKLLDLYRHYAQALALSGDSVYNTALDHLERANRAMEEERAMRCQRVVVDEAYEDQQVLQVFNNLLKRFFRMLEQRLYEVEGQVDWLADSLQVHAPLDDPDAPEGIFELGDLSREPDETAAQLFRWLERELSGPIAAALAENSILNFISYLNPNAAQLGSEMVERSGPLARTLVPPARQTCFLFSPDPDAANRMAYIRELVYELYQQLGNLYQIDNGDADRMILFRRFDGLTLENLSTFLACDPDRVDPLELKSCLLWDL